MKVKYFLFSIISLLSLVIGLKLVNPQAIFAQACPDGTTDNCTRPPNIGCNAGSVRCQNGQCSYTRVCNETCPGGYGNWYPDPCAVGEYQSQECSTDPTQFHIRQCGTTGGGGGGTGPGYTCAAGYSLKCGPATPYDPTLRRQTGNVKCIRARDANCYDPYWPAKYTSKATMGYGCGTQDATVYRNFCQINCGCCTAAQVYIDGIGCTSSTSVPATPSPSPIPTPSCTVSVAAANNPMQVGSNTTVTAAVGNIVGTVNNVTFTSNTGAVTLSSGSVNNPGPYVVTATAQTTAGSPSTIRVGVIMGGIERCFDTATLTVTNTQAWWQVEDGDVTAANGSIQSDVPATAGVYFDTNGIGGFPGVAVHGGLSIA